ncbi:MAG: glycosyltransferase [Snowella sp.]|nr:glycosyltransferase [Snowella sp.]
MQFPKRLKREHSLVLLVKFWVNWVQKRWATLVFLSIISSFFFIAIAWYAEVSFVCDFFAQLNFWQQSPPAWFKRPVFNHAYELYLPTIAVGLMSQIIVRGSSRSQFWPRAIMLGMFSFFALRYFLWRSLVTLNLSNPTDGLFSLLLWGCELIGIILIVLMSLFSLQIKDRHQQANHYSQAVLAGTYLPTVDILIPTYNEPDFILKRSIIGCQALNYPHKNIYVLDELRRENIQKLCQELGCSYLTRPDNRYAKAGNLNHALLHTQGELIVVFDADFIPTTNFLTRTVGFFQNPQIGLVQTPQSFYNPDPIAKNLGLEKVLASDEEIFYRKTQIMKDNTKTVICSGTSFVVRREALEQVGNFVTDSLSEDYFTGVEISAKGYELVYLPEKLSAGLSAESIGNYLAQRSRWGQGSLQAFFIQSNPLTIPGLTWMQRLAHLEGLLHWFNTFPRIVLLLIPFLYTCLGIIPFQMQLSEIAYFFLPYYVLYFSSYRWLNDYAHSSLFSDLYSLVSCVPLTRNLINTFINPFGRSFKVTPKGTHRNQITYDWKSAFPVLILLVLIVSSLIVNLSLIDQPDYPRKFALTLIWSGYNLILLLAALQCFLDRPQLDSNAWFMVNQSGILSILENQFEGTITQLSEGGAEIIITQSFDPKLLDSPIQLMLPDKNLQLPGKIQQILPQKSGFKIHLQFKDLTLHQQRQLIEFLFCRPGTWKKQKAPGEFASLRLIIAIAFKPFAKFIQWGLRRPLMLD